MTQEQKDLLLKDLCARLPYGVIVNVKGFDFDFKDKLTQIYKEGYGCSIQVTNNMPYGIEQVKPYLFPLSSMTDELWDKEFRGYCITEFTRDSFKYGCETLEFYNGNPVLSNINGFINSLIKNHFDIYGLIPMGLANDATGKNIY